MAVFHAVHLSVEHPREHPVEPTLNEPLVDDRQAHARTARGSEKDQRKEAHARTTGGSKNLGEATWA